jgi:RNA polymerase sigma factor (sigma-70 family)
MRRLSGRFACHLHPLPRYLCCDMMTPIPATTHNDAELVAESLRDRRDAFGQIVERYKSLICSLAYSATGSLSQSEDLAQETFLTAWRLLPELREPTKLRPWLCGIARNLIGKTLRREGRQPIHKATSLETAQESLCPDPLPCEQTISREEEAILRRSIERIPAAYREPLILFYREEESIERIAAELEISEDAVKKRLSRGRKLLTDEITAFVEVALKRSAPGKAFTFGVLAALPATTSSAKAAVIASVAAKGSTVAKAAASSGLLNAILGPVLMFFGTYFSYKLDADTARSPQARKLVNSYYGILTTCIAAFILIALLLTFTCRPLLHSRPALYVGLWIGLGAIYLVAFAVIIVWMRSRRQKLRGLAAHPAQEQTPGFDLVPVLEYRSKLSLLGLPLIHIRLRGGLERGPVKAWIAAGDAAVGVLFAFGAVAVAPISFGGLSLGLLTLGGLAVGIMSFGGFSFGLWAIGGFAIGWQAFGACAVAWSAAHGAVTVAGDFASGAAALGRHANDSAAQVFFANSRFFQGVHAMMRYAPWLNLLWFFPLALWWRQKNKSTRL